MKSRLLQILFIIIHHPTDRHSLPSSTPPNPAPCQHIHTHHNAEQRRAQRGGVWGGETGFATLSASPPHKFPRFIKPNLYPQNKNIKKHIKKRDHQPLKSNSLKKKKKTLFILTLSYLFLTFSSISSALSISLFSSFGRTILRIIANTAAGTIPDPPKIRLIACGRCTRIAVLEPSP